MQLHARRRHAVALALLRLLCFSGVPNGGLLVSPARALQIVPARRLHVRLGAVKTSTSSATPASGGRRRSSTAEVVDAAVLLPDWEVLVLLRANAPAAGDDATGNATCRFRGGVSSPARSLGRLPSPTTSRWRSPARNPCRPWPCTRRHALVQHQHRHRRRSSSAPPPWSATSPNSCGSGWSTTGRWAWTGSTSTTTGARMTWHTRSTSSACQAMTSPPWHGPGPRRRRPGSPTARRCTKIRASGWPSSTSTSSSSTRIGTNRRSTVEPDVGQVSLGCADFGPSGQTANPKEGVTQGYTCRRRTQERHKSLLRLHAVDDSLVNSIHHFALRPGFRGQSNKQVRVNHYKYQAWEEFKVKFRRRVSTYVTDWTNPVNLNSKDRTPGLGFEAVEPADWTNKFCEVNDTLLRDATRRWFGVGFRNGQAPERRTGTSSS